MQYDMEVYNKIKNIFCKYSIFALIPIGMISYFLRDFDSYVVYWYPLLSQLELYVLVFTIFSYSKLLKFCTRKVIALRFLSYYYLFNVLAILFKFGNEFYIEVVGNSLLIISAALIALSIVDFKKILKMKNIKRVLNSIWKFILSIILLFVSTVLLGLLLPWGLVEHLIKLFWRRRFWKGLVIFSELILLFAVIIDVIGNVVMQVPMNRIFITADGYRFGSRFDTISYVLGHNLVNNSLTKKGKIMCNILDFFEADHCAKTYYKRNP